MTWVIDYAMAAYATRICLKTENKTASERYDIAQFWLVNHFGLTRDQANKFIISYLAEWAQSRVGR